MSGVLLPAMNVFKKYWPHIVLWAAMVLYFLFAPDLFTLAFIKTGKPLQTDGKIPAGSDKITFVVEELGSYIKGGENLYNLYGWAYIAPEPGETADGFVREVALVSEKEIYFFAVRSTYRSPGPQSMFDGAAVDLNTLGFTTLIAEDAIKPGKYRIGIVFRNPSTGTAFYRDKPAHYLIKTPNTLTLK